jgi:2,4-diaminopentanoate dehydrogenase
MLRVIQIGLGPLGRKTVQFADGRPGLRIVAAVDPAPGIAGRTLRDLCEGAGGGVAVASSLPAALSSAAEPPEVAILTTSSDLDRVEGQLCELADAGLPVVSTCEELSYPWTAHPDHAARIDARFRERSVASLGTGVNPGFLMDYLPAVLTGLCRSVRHVTVRRVQDASARRVPFQVKIGACLSIDEFAARVAEGSLRHVGLPESTHFVAAALGLRLERVEEELRPVLSEHRVTTGFRPIESGMACGVEQIARGYADGREVVRLEFRATVGEAESFDQVEIDGEPSLLCTIAGGVNGDIATCAVVLNALAVVVKASPGLHTMLDLPIPTVGSTATGISPLPF